MLRSGINTIERVSPGHKLPNISKGILIFIATAILWELWRIPNDFPSLFSIVSRIGIGRVAIGLTLFYVFHLSRQNALVLPRIGQKVLLLFILGFLLSFLLAAMESSFGAHLRNNLENNSLAIYGIVKGLGYFLMFSVFFSYEKNFVLLLNSLVIAGFVVVLLVILGIDQPVLSVFGAIKFEGQYQVYEKVAGISHLRQSFGSLDNNTYGGILAGLGVIALYKFLVSQQKIEQALSLVFVFLSGYSVLVTASRSNSLKLALSVITLVFLSRRILTNRFKWYFLLSILVAATWMIATQRFEFAFVLIERWAQIAMNASDYFRGSLTLEVTDNFSWRILAALASLPTTLGGWIFGNGGIQTGYVWGISSASHIEFANWLSQYGLVTFIPLIGYLFAMFTYLMRYSVPAWTGPPRRDEVLFLRYLGISLLVGLGLEMMNSPLFFGLWFWLGVITCIVSILERQRIELLNTTG